MLTSFWIVITTILTIINYGIVVRHSFNNEWRNLWDAPLNNLFSGTFSAMVLMVIMDKFF